MVDRLRIIEGREISEIWQDILIKSNNCGELFTLQLHPERISYCESALVDVIQRARELNPPVWLATLREIAEWWLERDKFSLDVGFLGGGKHMIKANCSERATILIKNCRVNTAARAWADGYQSVGARDFILESSARPVIGISKDSSPAALDFLKSEGYIIECGEPSGNFGIYLGNLAQFDAADEKPLSRRIEQSDAPLLRYWRWPGQTRSALSVTGDIDSITLTDFVLRIFENWQQSLKLKSRKVHV